VQYVTTTVGQQNENASTECVKNWVVQKTDLKRKSPSRSAASM